MHQVIFFILSMIGTILNVRRDWRGFIFWAAANTGWVVIDFKAGLYAQSLMFLIYLVLALWGIYDWRKRPRGKPADLSSSQI